MSEQNKNKKDDAEQGGKTKKKYDGSRAPFVLVKNLKTTKAIDGALDRVKKRFSWIKQRNLEIQRGISDPNKAPYEKKQLFAENKKLASDVPGLQQKERELKDKRPAIKEQEEKELEAMQLEEININDE